LSLGDKSDFTKGRIDIGAGINIESAVKMNETEIDPALVDFPTQGVKTLLGNPKKAIIKLSVPMIVAMSVQTLYNFVDAIWVSGLGADALSAVGFFFPFHFIIMALSAGFGVGGASAVSRRIGARDKKGADEVGNHTLVIMIIISTVITVPLLILIPKIFTAMGAAQVTSTATVYARILFGGTFIFFFAQVASALLRAEGDVKRAMHAMMVGAVLNIILDPIFIYVLDLGVAGAAWATLLSVTTASVFIFYWLCIRRDTYISISFHKFHFKKSIIHDIYRVGLPASIQHVAMSLSVFILNIIAVRAGGTDGVAIYTTGWRVVMFAVLPLLGMATAVVSVIGAAYGAKDYDKLNKAFSYAVKLGMIIELCVAAVIFILAPVIARLFTFSEESLHLRHNIIIFLRTMCIYFPTTPFGMFSSSMFQGTAKGTYALITTTVRTVLLTAPIAYIFALLLNWGLPGIWWGIAISNILGAGFAYSWARYYIKHLNTDRIQTV
jgi:putative MATE family efflux protein